MQKEKFIIIPNKKELKLYEEYNFNNFILPLNNYSIGFDVYFDIEEINKLAKSHQVYVMINMFMHKKLSEFKKIYDKFDKNIIFIVEDIGFTDIIDSKKLVLFENHIISNYAAINYLNSIGYSKLVINNDLTISEIEEIISKTKGELYYFSINRNNIMYSKRKLVSNFNEYFNIKSNNNTYKLIESVSKEELTIKEENNESILFYDKLFCANKYIDKLEKLGKLIINFSGINEIEERIILENYDKKELVNLINCDYYFLEHDIKYKVGDIK